MINKILNYLFKFFNIKYMEDSIKVFENIGDNIVPFETKEDFMRYYNKNQNTIDAMSTRGLNRKFKIDGFKIGRLQGKIILYPLKESERKAEQSEPKSEELDSKTKLTINEKLDFMNRRLKKMEEMLEIVIQYFEQND